MKFSVTYKLEKQGGMMSVSATFILIKNKNSFKTSIKDEYDYLKWVLIPEWIKQGIVFLPVEDFKRIDEYTYYEVFILTKKDDIFTFELANKYNDEEEVVIARDLVEKFALSLNYEKYIESGKFTLDQLVKKKVIIPDFKIKRRNTKATDLEYEE